jgi:hypothetical protein
MRECRGQAGEVTGALSSQNFPFSDDGGDAETQRIVFQKDFSAPLRLCVKVYKQHSRTDDFLQGTFLLIRISSLPQILSNLS